MAEQIPYPDQQLHNDCVSLGSRHVQRGPVNFSAGVPADAGSEQDVCGGIVAMLSCQMEGRRAQLWGRSNPKKKSDVAAAKHATLQLFCSKNVALLFNVKTKQTTIHEE